MAIAAVVTLIGVGLAVSSAAVVATNSAIGGTTRDERSKDALAAADAAAQLAIFRQNQVNTNETYKCVVEGAGGDLVAGSEAADGWCPEVSGQAGDASWTYRTSPAVVNGIMKRFEIVATGNADGITRRINVDAETPIATRIFSEHTVIGDDGITINNDSLITGNAAANNGNIVLSGPNAQICGSTQVGPGYAVVPGPRCTTGTPPPPTEGTVDLPPIDPTHVELATSTSRFFTQDLISGNPNKVHWNPTARTLKLDSDVALTLGGNDYALCRLELSAGSKLIIASGAKVRLFFDRPENCPAVTDGRQVILNANSQVTVTSNNPADFGIFVLGSEDPNYPTKVELNANSGTTFPVMLYAPNSSLTINSSAHFIGGLAANTVSVSAKAKITADSRVNDFELPILLHYRQTRYVECSAADQLTNPDDYC